MVSDRSYTGLVLESGCLNRVHYGLAMAAAALAISQPVVLFFTNAALLSLRAPAPDGRPGWATCPLGPDLVAAGVAGDATGWNAGLVTRGAAGVEDLIEACRDLGARFMVCDMGLRAIGLEKTALRDDLSFEEGGLVSLYRILGDTGRLVVI
ncbi:hypothetical protein V6768_25140 [Tistrella mobilis]